MRRGFFAVIIFLLFTVIFAHYMGWLLFVENFLRDIVNPGSSVAYKIGLEIDGTDEEFDNIDDLKNAYRTLKNENVQNTIDKIKLELLETENKHLKEQLNFIYVNGYNTLGATVVGKSTDPLRYYVTIDRGRDDGLQEGFPVIAENGIFVGKVTRLENKYATVQLLDDQQSKVAATIMNKDKSIGIVEGGYGLSMQMNFIPQNEIISAGDSIITSGLEKNIPHGLLIGTVDAVEKEAYQPFQRAIVTSVVNLDKLRQVSVIVGKK